MNRLIHACLAMAVASFPAALPAQEDTTPTLTQQAAAGRMLFNFEGVPLETVLDAMSRSLGLVVIRDVPLEGRVNVVSHQPLDTDEAVALLNTVLHQKGYAGILSGRTLIIVNRDDAKQKRIPVRVGSNPEDIPASEEMVTQIIPVRHAKASEMIENLKGLLPAYATISANESSNAIVLTDTQSSIRRVAEIVMALDQSISEISSIRVFQLRDADAKETADLIKALFQETSGGREGGSRFFRPPWDRGRDNEEREQESAALQASSRVVAAADERTNSVVVGAPENLMPTIEELVSSLDQSVAVLTEVRVFPLASANAEEMAATINGIFGEPSGSSRNNQVRRFSDRSREGSSRQASNESEREIAESTVLAVADTRTNSIIVSAVSSTMTQVAGVIEELDKNPAKTKKVHVYSLENANPEDVATMLEEMFGESRGTTNNNRRATNNNNRNTNNRNTTNNNRQSSNNRNTGGSSR